MYSESKVPEINPTSVKDKIADIILHPIIVSIAFLVLCTGITAYMQWDALNEIAVNGQSDLKIRTNTIGTHIEEILYKLQSTSQQLSSFIMLDSNVSEKQFSKYANTLLDNDRRNCVMAVSFTNNYTIKYSYQSEAYPIDVATSLVGYDLREERNRHKILDKYLRVGKTYVEGPIILPRSHRTKGLFIISPVYYTNESGRHVIYGTTVLSVNWSRVSEQFKLFENSSAEEIILIGNTNGDTSNMEVLAGDYKIYDEYKKNNFEYSASHTIKLGIGKWILITLKQKDNWKIEEGIFFKIYIGIAILSILLYFLMRIAIDKIGKNAARYKFLIENANDAIWTIDYQSMKYIFISDSIFKINGFTYDELVGKRIYSTINPDDEEAFYKVVSQTKELLAKQNSEVRTISNRMLSFETHAFHKDGSRIWLEYIFKVIFDNKNNPSRIVGSVRRIDARKKIEIALYKSESNYRAIIDNSTDGHWTIEIATMRFVYASEAAHRLTGHTAADYDKLPISQILTNDSAILMHEFYEKRQKIYKETPNDPNIFKATFEVQLKHKNGNTFWTEIKCFSIPDEDGKIREIQGISSNIDDRKRLEFALLESENRYSIIVNNSLDAICAINYHTKKITFASPSALYVIGYYPNELTGNITMRDIYTIKSYVTVEESLLIEMENHKRGLLHHYVPTEIQLLHKDGSKIWCEISHQLTYDEFGQPDEIVCVIRRIDERKELEQQLLQHQNELQSINHSKDKLLSIISHDIRNPISAIISMCEYLKAKHTAMTPEKLRNNIDIIYEGAAQTLSLLSELLDWTRNSMGIYKFQPQMYDLAVIINSAIEKYATVFKSKEITVNFNENLNEKFAFCDCNMIETIIRNLLSNAVKFSRQNSEVNIYIDNYPADIQYHIITIKDNGVGIPQSVISELFNTQTNSSHIGTDKEVGTGLGLTICKEFVEKHRCKIWVDSQVDAGSSFYFTLSKKEQK
ncbi:MAG: PAS domain S-box protein [Ignavibacteria bacterium]|jgi:PAS domain S-box-containing protein|nr:PAS domain S-box protein [Ignavibacteria bacterium]